jgi:hypothetical protein
MVFLTMQQKLVGQLRRHHDRRGWTPGGDEQMGMRAPSVSTVRGGASKISTLGPLAWSSKSRSLRLCALAWTAVILCLAWSLPPAALAQNRSLPRAGFNTYNGGPLPNAGGIHLGGGDERAANAPPEVYNPGEKQLEMKTVRWENRHMPLRVWISPGGKLPEEPFSQVQAHRPQEVLNMLMSGQDLAALPQCPGFSPEMVQSAANGIEQWRPFQNEGLFSFQFVDDPSQAQIMVFWVDRFIDSEQPGGSSVHGNTVATLFDADLVHTTEARDRRPVQGAPVIIELKVNGETDKLQADAAHEFGHALGIKEHSPYRQDIMFVNRQVMFLSPSDKATIRWLYKQRTPYVMLPPVNIQPVARQAPPQQQQVPEEPPPPQRTYKISPSRTRPFPDTEYDGAGESSREDTVRERPAFEKKQLPDKVDGKADKEKKKKEKQREEEPPEQVEPVQTGPRNDFDKALDEIRGIKRKEPKPVKTKKGESGSDVREKPPEEEAPRPSDGF